MSRCVITLCIYLSIITLQILTKIQNFIAVTQKRPYSCRNILIPKKDKISCLEPNVPISDQCVYQVNHYCTYTSNCLEGRYRPFSSNPSALLNCCMNNKSGSESDRRVSSARTKARPSAGREMLLAARQKVLTAPAPLNAWLSALLQ